VLPLSATRCRLRGSPNIPSSRLAPLTREQLAAAFPSRRLDRQNEDQDRESPRLMLRPWSNISIAVVWILYGLADCSTTTPVERYTGPATRSEVVYVISGGWHTELGLPLAEVSGPLAALNPNFSSAQYLVFGWGAHDYYMVRNPGIGELLRAAVPGPAVMLVIPLQIAPEAFFGASNAFVIPVSPDGVQRLSQFLWGYLAMDKEGSPRRLSTGPYPQSLFYASTGTYDLGHTCNTWTAEALRVASLPVSAAGVVFAGQVLDQLPPLLEAAPRASPERTMMLLPGS
jgi:uncharacterized protein (TIGR02117 family)